jgi:glycosyltransferase involved in cell wall biosynthesis
VTAPGAVRAAAEPEEPFLSVVVPFYNEEAVAGGLLAELRRVLDGLGTSWEVVAVDDASVDATRAILSAAARAEPRIRVLSWDDNRGQAAALYRGLRAARAPLIATLDGDGQNDPADLPALLAGLRRVDMMVGIRADRHDSRLRRWMSRLANRVRGRLLGDRVRDSGCALKVFRREVIDALIPIRSLYSFVPALALAAGFSVDERVVAHRPRMGGVSSYGLRAFLWRPALDLLGVWWFTRRRFRLPLGIAEPGFPRSVLPADAEGGQEAAPALAGRAHTHAAVGVRREHEVVEAPDVVAVVRVL